MGERDRARVNEKRRTTEQTVRLPADRRSKTKKKKENVCACLRVFATCYMLNAQIN